MDAFAARSMQLSTARRVEENEKEGLTIGTTQSGTTDLVQLKNKGGLKRKKKKKIKIEARKGIPKNFSSQALDEIRVNFLCESLTKPFIL